MDEVTTNDTIIQHINLVDESDAYKDNTRTGASLEPEEPTGKRARTNTSPVWVDFTKIGVGKDGKERAKCNGCGRTYVIGGNSGTSHLTRHRSKCHLLPRFHDVGDMIIDQAGKLQSRKPDYKRAREIATMAIIEHDLPFSFIEYRRFTEFVKVFYPEYIPISRKTISSDIKKLHLVEKEKLKQVLERIPGKVCLTSDLWTASTNEGYICLTAHFVDENWKLNSKILSFCYMPPPHTSLELSKKMYDLWKDWGIDKKVFSLTLDNASANDCMQEFLKDQLKLHGTLVCDGEFFHVRCCAHILHLIVKEGLTVASGALHKIRESVKYVKGSESRMKNFWECVNEVGSIDIGVGLRLDVATRWNSTYLMLDSALKYQHGFSYFQLNDLNYK